MTLSKLSLRNAKRQARDYTVYFITIVMAAALIYAFNSLVFSEEIQNLSSLMKSLPLMVMLASLVVVIIIGWLVAYTTKFMLKRRSRELGTYILVGLENRQVARLFFLENLAVGAVAFVAGTFLGNLLFQALRAITLSMFDRHYEFGFSFSPWAMLLSLAYFALIYLFALTRSRRRISKMKICDLIHYDRKNEGVVIRKDHVRRRIFSASIVFGIAGTMLLLLKNLTLALIGAAFVITFLYGFFLSFSSGVPGYFNKRPEQKYRGHTVLVLRNLTAKVATMGLLMATIALLFTGTLIAEGTGIIFNSLFQRNADQTTCFDLFIGIRDPAPGAFDEYISYLDETIPDRESWQYEVYLADNAQVTDYVQTNNSKYLREFDGDTLMKQSDYSALRAMLGYPPVELAPGRYLIHCMTYLNDVLESYDQPIQVGKHVLESGEVQDENFTQSLWDGNGRGFIIVVPDEVLNNQSVSHGIYAVMTPLPVAGPHYEELSRLRDEKADGNIEYDTIFSKAAIESENASMFATIVFPLYYLAMVLTMVAATILTIQQLDEMERYRRQFRLLGNLGMERHEMIHILRDQFAIFFAMPALPPVLISIPFIVSLGNSLDAGVLSGPGQLIAIVAATLFLFFAIYFIYVAAAYASLKRSVLPE